MSQSVEQETNGTVEPGRGKRSLAEKVSFSIASGILATIVGLVLYLWASQERQNPPELSLQPIDAIREANGQFYVPYELTNTGGSTVESVRVLAELTVNGEVEESGEQEFGFLSSQESEEGAFVFSQDPRSGTLTLRVTGYKLP